MRSLIVFSVSLFFHSSSQHQGCIRLTSSILCNILVFYCFCCLNFTSFFPSTWILASENPISQIPQSTVLIIKVTDNTPLVFTLHTLNQSSVIFRLVFNMFPFPRSTNSVECRFLPADFCLSLLFWLPPHPALSALFEWLLLLLNYRSADILHPVICRVLLDLTQLTLPTSLREIYPLLMWLP